MRYLLSILLAVGAYLHSPSQVKGATLITATITVTNPAGVGSNFTVNGDVRTWTNNVGVPPFDWITTSASVGGTATNLYNHIIRFPYSGPDLLVSRSSTNVIVLKGYPMVIAPYNYFTVSYQTNQGTNLAVIQVPFDRVDGTTNRTNNANWLVDALNTYASTSRLGTNAFVAGNFLTKGASTGQVVSGSVQFGGSLRAASEFTATNGFTKNLTNINPVLSNGVNYGSAFRSEGSGGNSFAVGSNAIAAGNLSAAIGNGALASNANSLAVGVGALATNDYGTAIGSGAMSLGQSAIAIGRESTASNANAVAIGAGAGGLGTGLASVSIGYNVSATATDSIAIGNDEDTQVADTGGIAIGWQAQAGGLFSMGIGSGAQSGYSNSAAIGPFDDQLTGVNTTTTNQLRLGTSRQHVSIPGQLLVSGTQSNTTFTGTNIAGGSWSYPRKDLTSLAAGNNLAVPAGTNRFIRLGAGPASAATIVGIVGGATTGGNDGQDVVFYNDTGYALTFAVNSVDPVPANRINTPTGGDISIPDQGWAQFLYDATDARWKLINTFSGTNLVATATTTNAIYAVSTNSALVSGAATNLNLIYGAGIEFRATNTSGKVDIQILTTASGTNQIITTNGVTLGQVGTVAWDTGVTGYVSGAVAHLGTTGGAGSGEANVNGETSVTNATRLGLVAGKSGVTNLLRSLQGGNGITLTNQGTNIMAAIDPAVVASQANLTTASNSLVTEIGAASNSLYTAETTRNAAVSNSVISHTMTTSNSLYSTETTRNAAVSNGVYGQMRWLTNRVLAVNGTSLDTTNAFTDIGATWSNTWVGALYTFYPGWQFALITNFAQSGKQISAINAEYDTTLHTVRPNTTNRLSGGMFIIGNPFNDLRQGSNAVNQFAMVSNMAWRARLDNVLVAVTTIHQSTGLAYQASQEIQRTNYNNLLMSETNRWMFDYVFDICSWITNSAANEIRSVYSSDGIHYNTLCSHIIASNVNLVVTDTAVPPLGMKGGTVIGGPIRVRLPNDVPDGNIERVGLQILSGNATAGTRQGYWWLDSSGLPYSLQPESGQNVGIGYGFSFASSISSRLTVRGAVSTAVNSPVTLSSSLYVDDSTGLQDSIVGIPNGTARTNQLPSAASFLGREITIFDAGRTASGTNIWVNTVSSQPIDGGPVTTNIIADGGSITLVSDGSGWRTKGVIWPPRTTSGTLILPDGSAAIPSFAFASNPDMGISRSANNTMRINAAGGNGTTTDGSAWNVLSDSVSAALFGIGASAATRVELHRDGPAITALRNENGKLSNQTFRVYGSLVGVASVAPTNAIWVESGYDISYSRMVLRSMGDGTVQTAKDLAIGKGTNPVIVVNGPVQVNTNIHVLETAGLANAVLTNNIGYQVGTVAGVGGANTNFTIQASGDESIIYVNAGTTNVNIVAIMGYSSTIAYRGTVILTNRTATARNFSLGATTNNWISLQKYDGISAPFVVTNSLAGRFTYEILGTNVQYSYKPMDLPSN